MRRELRRHPVEPKPVKGSNRQTRASSRNAVSSRVMPGAAVTASGDRVRGLPSIMQPAWFREVFTELRKVQWPTRQETINLTLVVLVVAIALGLFLGGLDAIFNWLIEHTLLS